MFRVFVLCSMPLLFGAVQNSSATVTGGLQQPKTPLKQLLGDLESKDENIKLKAIKALIDFGPEAAPAMPALLEAIQSDNEHLRLNAALALGKIGKSTVPEVMKLLKADKESTRYYAVWTLGIVGPAASSTAPDVVTLLKDKNDDVRRKAAHALGRIRPAAEIAIAPLLTALQDDDDNVRLAAGSALAQFRDKPVPELRKMLGQKNGGHASAAAYTLGVIGPDAKAAAPELEGMLLDKEWKLRGPAASALTKIGKDGFLILAQAMSQDDVDVKLHALQALTTFGIEAVPHIILAVDDDNVDVRRVAVHSLVSFKSNDKAVVLAFAKALREEDEPTGRYAVAGLVQIGSASAPAMPELRAGHKNDSTRVRVRCLQVMEALGPAAKSAIPDLKVVLLQEDVYLASKAASTLNAIGKSALPALIEGLKHPNTQVRMQVLEILAKGQDENVVPHIVEAMSDKNVRLTMVQRLASNSSFKRTVLLVLAHVIEDEDAKVRSTAIDYVWQQKKEALPVMPQLIAGLKSQDDYVRWCCAWTLGAIGPLAKEAVPILTKMAEFDPDLRARASAKESLNQILSK